MRRLNLSEWAAVAEIIGTFGVIVSLLFVAYSINRNTELLQSENSSLIYQLDSSAFNPLIEDGALAMFVAKRSLGLDFNNENEAKLFYMNLRDLLHWDLMLKRHKDGLLGADQYKEWSDYYAESTARHLDFEWWNAVRWQYEQDLVTAVDAAYSGKEGPDR